MITAEDRRVPAWVAVVLAVVAVVAIALAVFSLLTRQASTPRSFESSTVRPQLATAVDSQGMEAEVTPASMAAVGRNQTLVAVPEKSLEPGWYAVRVGDPVPDSPTPASQCVPLGTDTPPLLMGSKKATHYHLMDCEWANRIPERNKVFFMGAQYAQNTGYIPCEDCSPPLK